MSRVLDRAARAQDRARGGPGDVTVGSSNGEERGTVT